MGSFVRSPDERQTRIFDAGLRDIRGSEVAALFPGYRRRHIEMCRRLIRATGRRARWCRKCLNLPETCCTDRAARLGSAGVLRSVQAALTTRFALARRLRTLTGPL